ncbi:hypothetical protein LSAT2_018893 [Lamellibrachia satsuma]|nr:hypothetical protein LSAT2_018893 [Lamellibrachia satsuma]
MGCCASICSQKDADAEESEPILQRKKGEKPGVKYPWEQNLMDETLMKQGKLTHAVIVSYSDCEIRAVAPANFSPSQEGLRHIVVALKGDMSGLAAHGIALGSGTDACTPGKIDSGKAIYASNGDGGGCVTFKSAECVLVGVYEKDPAAATRLCSEVAEHMTEQGH